MRRFLPWLSLPAFAASLSVAPLAGGCGGAVASNVSGGGDAGSPAVDGSSPGPPSCATLALVAGPTVVTDGTSAAIELDALAGDGAFAAWRQNAALPSGTPVPLMVRELGPMGHPLAPAQQALATLGTGGAVADGSGHAAVLSPDAATTCRFVPVGADGSPTGAVQSSPASWCGGLHPTHAGFDWLASDTSAGTLSLVRADANGVIQDTHELDASGAPAWVARAYLPDDSFLLATTPPLLSNCACPTPITVGHYGADGTAISTGHAGGHAWPGQGFALVTLGDAALLLHGAGTTPEGAVTATALDADGHPSGAEFVLGSAAAGSSSGLSIEATTILSPPQALVTWIASSGTTTPHVVAQVVSLSGTESQALDVATSDVGLHARVARISAAGAVVAWDGPRSGSNAVKTAVVACGP